MDQRFTAPGRSWFFSLGSKVQAGLAPIPSAPRLRVRAYSSHPRAEPHLHGVHLTERRLMRLLHHRVPSFAVPQIASATLTFTSARNGRVMPLRSANWRQCAHAHSTIIVGISARSVVVMGSTNF